MEVGQLLHKRIKVDAMYPAHIAQGGDLVEVSTDGFEFLSGIVIYNSLCYDYRTDREART